MKKGFVVAGVTIVVVGGLFGLYELTRIATGAAPASTSGFNLESALGSLGGVGTILGGSSGGMSFGNLFGGGGSSGSSSGSGTASSGTSFDSFDSSDSDSDDDSSDDDSD
ncbi:MAG TPA: hypothetical protein VMB05_18370 [Solirubrobacteraceae bacterium]|nr:hypothetical protein [Solirubrobacteraceae bacterium]